ncbi:hypothetical protein Goari_016835, partial [Gossypium aridum]|nr:hypothetical protein [Gossypium aridum]
WFGGRIGRSSHKCEARWLTYIRRDFLNIFQSATRIWTRKSDERRCKNIYTEYPSKCLFIMDSDGWVKILPNLDTPNSKMKDDIDELKVVMDFINNYPFGSAIQGYNHFKLLAKLIAFLGYLNSKFL